ncbi:SRPBCC domain-containing protein [Marinilabiliaceae bacterium JC017]|nr:SRPBCC domain-containing protein [Marinilabiliaceae bacterium JC017]
MSVKKEKFELEYIINTSPSIVFNRLSSPSGLSEWFADDVNLVGKTYTFVWEGSGQEAELVLRKENKMIRFHWLDDEDESTYFEFRINVDEITGETALLIIDFAEPDDKDDAIELWNQQIDELKHGLGA